MKRECRWSSPNCQGCTDGNWWTEPCVPRSRITWVCSRHVADAILKDYKLLDRNEAVVYEVLAE